MNRVAKLQIELLKIINTQDENIQRDETLDWERLHMASSARVAWLLALDRGADPELCAAAAAVHDFGRIITGRQAEHAEAGFLPVQALLHQVSVFSEDEINVIAQAVKNHSKKTEVGSLCDEIVKDADVIDCYQFGLPFDRPEKQQRYEAWLASKSLYASE